MNNNGTSKPTPNHQKMNTENATTMSIMFTPKGESGKRDLVTTIDMKGNLLKHYFSCMQLRKRKKEGMKEKKRGNNLLNRMLNNTH